MTKAARPDGDRLCIVGYARTPMGSFGGALSSVTAPQLGAVAIRAAMARSTIQPHQVDEVFMGNVVSANVGQAPARQAALAAGLPASTPCTTVNKMCASGMKAIMLGCQAIRGGDAHVVVCGGFESMSNAPFYSPATRNGQRFGDSVLIDGLGRDGLRCAYSNEPMGNSAALCAAEERFSREEQDAFAARSYERAARSARDGIFAAEIAPVTVPGKRKGAPAEQVCEDEEPLLREVTLETLQALAPAFAPPRRSGDAVRNSPYARSVTAGNSSVISDGAAAVVVCSERFAAEHGIPVCAFIDAFADAAHDPEHFTTAPTAAARKALGKLGRSPGDVHLWEINEAFSVVALANARLLGAPLDTVNVLGGAVAMGHPIGASGARILVTLITALKRTGNAVGCAAICNGGGGASAMVITRASNPPDSRL